MLSLRNTLWRSCFSFLVIIALTGSLPAAGKVKVESRFSHPLLPVEGENSSYIKISLTGQQAADSDHAPVNLAIVLDKSKSMIGDKLEKAKAGAILAIKMLKENDIVSVVLYDSRVQVLVPATNLYDRDRVIERIYMIRPSGSTALYGGVKTGSNELRKFIAQERVNRILLLSDGVANVGPSSTEEIVQLAKQLNKEGIAVSTIGVGSDYNFDLMSKLALASDGNYYFAESAHDLPGIYKRELDSVLTVVAKNIIVEIQCANGVRPVRVLGRKTKIDGRKAIVKLGHLTGGSERYVVLQVDTSAGENGQQRSIASVNVSYTNLKTLKKAEIAQTIHATYEAFPIKVEQAISKDILIDAVEIQAAETSLLATELRSKGNYKEPKFLYASNSTFLMDWSVKLNSTRLHKYQQEQQELHNISHLNYHPKFGTTSEGDVVRVKQ